MSTPTLWETLWERMNFALAHDPVWFIVSLGVMTVLFVAVMASLHFLPQQGKKWLTIGLTFIAGLFFFLEYLLPVTPNAKGELENVLSPAVVPISDYINAIFIWTVLLGLISLAIVHGNRLFKRRPGWHNSLAFFVALIAIIVAGVLSRVGQVDSSVPGVSWHALVASTVYQSLFAGVLVNLDAAMFSLLAFYIASAAYRAFRVRTVEAAMLMVAALIVMLGMVNFGVWFTSWIPADSPWAFFRLEELTRWLLSFINMAGQRAVFIGVAVGGLAMAMRLWLSLERGSFFSQE